MRIVRHIGRSFCALFICGFLILLGCSSESETESTVLDNYLTDELEESDSGTSPSASEASAQYVVVRYDGDEQPFVQMSVPGTERSIEYTRGDIYRFNDNDRSGVFMVTEEGVVVVDPLNVETATWLKNEIERYFAIPVTHVLYTHGHFDNASGAGVFGDIEIVSHINTPSVTNPSEDQLLAFGYEVHDKNGNGTIELTEAEDDLVQSFGLIDLNSDSVLTGSEVMTYVNRDIAEPTRLYDEPIYRFEIGGMIVEMHFVGGNHAADMSHIYFPQDDLVYYVEANSVKTPVIRRYLA